MAKARQQYYADEVTLQKESRDFAIQPEIIEKLDTIEPGAQVNTVETIKVNGDALEPDEDKAVDISVPLVDDTLYSTSSEDALSARQGRILYDYIQNLQSRGRFLSNWNCVTGLATTNPEDNPYQYRTGDYYLVSNVAALGGTNYRPNGSQYIINQASTTVESQTVKVSDMYIYDGTNWLLLVNTDREIAVDSSLSTTSTNPVENRVVTNALNGKQDTISDLATIRAGAALGDTALQPGDSLSQLTGTSDDISEGSTNLFMTTTERSKLSNQSGVNTGDETQTTIKNKLGQASTSTDGYLTSTDWNTFNGKQDAISDLATIRSDASAGKSASDTIATYGDIVTHDVSEFATATQGGLADTAVQPGDNISTLTNDAGYVTDAYHDSTKQDALIAGNNIQIAADGKTISATDTTYVASDFDIKDLSDSTGLRTEWSGKQDELIAGTNIQIAADGKTISATDTTYSAGVNISISNNNVISATDNKAVWGNITGTLSDQTDLNTALSGKQDTLIAGSNVQIASDGKTISATDTTYTAGTGISIDANNVISNTQTSAEWGNIQGDIADQTDLQTQFGTKQDNLVAGTNIQIAADGKTISATDTTYQPTDFDIKDLADSTNLRTTWSGKQNTIVAGTNVQIAADGVTISATDTTYTATDFDIKDLADSTSLRNTWSGKQDELIAGANIQIAADGKTISATDTTYTATDFDIKDLTDSTGLRTTWSGKQDAISDLATIRTGAGKGATAVQPLDNVSTLTNDAGYITKSVNDLTNYYTKSETYTKSEVADLVANFAGFKVVATLPTTDIKTNIIYLLGPVGSGADKYEEYIYSNNNWVMIGETSVDLTNYFNTSTQTSDAITQGSTNLFLTSAERTKLGNTSGTNTGDETKTTIQTKLGAASASNSGYLTSTDWSTFNSKADTTIIDDTAYASSWDADTTHAPTKNAVYDKISAMDTTIGNKANTSDVLTKTNTTTYTPSENYHPATKKYVDDAVNTASGGIISDTAYGSSWDGVSTVAPSKNAVYDKISAMDTTIGGKQDTISDLATIRTGAGKGATAVQPGDLATVATSGSYNDLSNKPTIPVVDSALSTTSTNALQNKVITDALNGKLDGFTRMFAGNWSGGVHPVKFCSVDYTTETSENGVFIKMSLVNSHGNGQAGRFLEDVILLVTYTGSVEGSIYRYFGTPTQYPGDYFNNSYGDIFWTIDTENKIVDFYVLMHQYSYTRMTPYFRLNRSTGGVITQAYEGASNPEYSSGTKTRATIYDYSKIPSKTSQLTNDSGFITSSALSGYQTTSNLKTSLTDNSDTYYPSQKAVKTAVDAKQDTLVSGTNIKTINNTSLLGSGNIDIQSGGNYTAGTGIDISQSNVISAEISSADGKEYKITKVRKLPTVIDASTIYFVSTPKPFGDTITISWTETSNPAEFNPVWSDGAAGAEAGDERFDNWFGYSGVKLSSAGTETATASQIDGVLDITQLGTLTSGDNVMIKFPVRGIKMSKSGDVVTLSMTKELNKSGYQYYAFNRNGTIKNQLYLGAYKGSRVSNVLKSWSGQTAATSPSYDGVGWIDLVNTTSGTPTAGARYSARQNNTSISTGINGWDEITWYARNYVNALYMMKYGNPNSKSVIGTGYFGKDSIQPTGATDSITDATGATDTSSTGRIKLFGLEDRWGNCYEWLDGAYYTSSTNLNVASTNVLTNTSWSTSPAPFNTNITTKSSGYCLKKVPGTNEGMFASIDGGGNSSTYYCTHFYSGSDYSLYGLCAGGSYYNNESGMGVFHVMNHDVDRGHNFARFASRLMFL